MISREALRAAAIAGISAALFAAAVGRGRPSAPAPADAPPAEFSALRAIERLRRILGPERPHPEGSPASLEVEERITTALIDAGCEPAVQRDFVCGIYGTCGAVRNLVARIPGREEHGAVLVAAHSDSVEAGPGAADDGLGVAAILEIATAIRSGPPLRRPVVLLIDDGEEQGLLGAEAFAAHHPWARDVSAVVNLEARGTSGASYLFETSGGDRGLVEGAKAIPHPIASSLFPSIYRLLPNDTDLTVFRRCGMPGVNFACIGGVARYHTPRDDLSHLSPATVQHEGESALAVVRSLAARPIGPRPAGDAVFFDLLGWKIAAWPQAAAPVLAAVALVLFALAVRSLRRRGLSWRGWAISFGAFAAMILVPAVLDFVARRLLRDAGALPASWTAHPFPALAGLWLLAVFGVAAVAERAVVRCGAAALSAGVWSGWALLAALTAVAMPGASFLFLIPLLAAVAAPTGLDPGSRTSYVAAPLAAFFWLPVAWRLWEALGFDGAALIAAVIAIPVSTLAPFAAALSRPARRSILVTLAAGAALALLASLESVPFTVDSPERLTFLWHQDADTGRSRWLAEGEPVPREVFHAARFGAPSLPFPWSSVPVREAPAPAQAVPVPEFRLEARTEVGGRTRFRGRIVSRRGAPFAKISFPPNTILASLRIGGTQVAPLSSRAIDRSRGWKSYACVTLPAEGIEVEGEVLGSPVEFVLTDRAPGLPVSGEALRRARPPTAVPSQGGDSSLVSRKIVF